MAGYDKLFLVGSGSYGNVWVVETQSSRKEKRVLKEVKLKGLGEKDIDQAVTEVAVLARCRHENIIGYQEAFVNREDMTLSIIMEYASRGDLHKQITMRRGLYFPNETVMSWFAQLMSALNYIHKRGILHRDIKPQNMFLNERHVLKLGDFGISRILHSDADAAVTVIGTPFYLSPEICRQQPYSYKSDMWSAGCVLYELCCLRVPFAAANLPSLVAQIQIGVFAPLPSHCDALLRKLVTSLLTSDPEKRLSASDILLIPEMQKYMKQKPSYNPSLMCEDLVNNLPHGKLPGSDRRAQKRAVEPREEEFEVDRKSPLYQRGDPVKQNLAKKVDSTTYTILKHPKVRRLSLASPELSVLIEKQRTQTRETQRAHSVDAPTVNKPRKLNSSPRLCLLKTVQQMRDVDNEVDDIDTDYSRHKDSHGKDNCHENTADRLTEAVYSNLITDDTPQENASKILDLLKRFLGQQEAEAVISAVKTKMSYKDLRERFDIQSSVVHAVLWVVKLLDGKS